MMPAKMAMIANGLMMYVCMVLAHGFCLSLACFNALKQVELFPVEITARDSVPMILKFTLKK